ncbi:MAG: hypothetical protein R3B91_05980 [Planctomycetaceae bacterium]
MWRRQTGEHRASVLLTLSRPPMEDESDLLGSVSQQTTVFTADLCLALFNLNEFIYLY